MVIRIAYPRNRQNHLTLPPYGLDFPETPGQGPGARRPASPTTSRFLTRGRLAQRTTFENS